MNYFNHFLVTCCTSPRNVDFVAQPIHKILERIHPTSKLNERFHYCYKHSFTERSNINGAYCLACLNISFILQPNPNSNNPQKKVLPFNADSISKSQSKADCFTKNNLFCRSPVIFKPPHFPRKFAQTQEIVGLIFVGFPKEKRFSTQIELECPSQGI